MDIYKLWLPSHAWGEPEVTLGESAESYLESLLSYINSHNYTVRNHLLPRGKETVKPPVASQTQGSEQQIPQGMVSSSQRPWWANLHVSACEMASMTHASKWGSAQGRRCLGEDVGSVQASVQSEGCWHRGHLELTSPAPSHQHSPRAWGPWVSTDVCTEAPWLSVALHEEQGCHLSNNH